MRVVGIHVHREVSMSLDHLKATWDRLARSDPLWAVLTDPAKTNNKWDVDEFLATGVREIGEVLSFVRSLDVEIRQEKALDFGCGAGRLTQALAGHFQEVHGVDISTEMVKTARRLNRQGEKCTFHVNDRADLASFPSDGFDFVYSRITLQHMQPHYAKAYIREFLRVIRPDGIVFFQMPSKPLTSDGRPTMVQKAARAVVPDRASEVWREWRYNRHSVMAMWWIELEEMVHLLRRNGAAVISVLRDDCAGQGWESFSYCVTRGGPGAPGH